MKITKSRAIAFWNLIARDVAVNGSMAASKMFPAISSKSSPRCLDAAKLLREMADALDGGEEDDRGGQKQD